MKNSLRVAMLVPFALLCACSAAMDAGAPAPTVPAQQQAPASPTSTETVPPLVGGDRDAHGCIASAGYQWCGHTGRCERSWELAKQEGFALDENGFATFCSGALRR